MRSTASAPREHDGNNQMAGTTPMYQMSTHVTRSELVISGVGVESLTERLDAMGIGSGAAARRAETPLKEGLQ